MYLGAENVLDGLGSGLRCPYPAKELNPVRPTRAHHSLDGPDSGCAKSERHRNHGREEDWPTTVNRLRVDLLKSLAKCRNVCAGLGADQCFPPADRYDL